MKNCVPPSGNLRFFSLLFWLFRLFLATHSQSFHFLPPSVLPGFLLTRHQFPFRERLASVHRRSAAPRSARFRPAEPSRCQDANRRLDSVNGPRWSHLLFIFSLRGATRPKAKSERGPPVTGPPAGPEARTELTPACLGSSSVVVAAGQVGWVRHRQCSYFDRIKL